MQQTSCKFHQNYIKTIKTPGFDCIIAEAYIGITSKLSGSNVLSKLLETVIIGRLKNLVKEKVLIPIYQFKFVLNTLQSITDLLA